MDNDNFDVYEPSLDKSRVYKGWEIIKMINDNVLGNGDIIYNCYLGTCNVILYGSILYCFECCVDYISNWELINNNFKICKVLSRDETIKEIRKGVIEAIVNLDSIGGCDAEISYKNVTNDTLTKMDMNVDRWVVVYK